MGLLATYGQFTSYVDAAGRYRYIWQEADGNIIMDKLPAYVTEVELEDIVAKKLRRRDWFDHNKLDFLADADRALIVTVVQYIRAHPTITLTQWNTYVKTFLWYQQNSIKAFIWRLAVGLAEHYGVVLSNYTESEVLQKVRNWLCNTNVNIVGCVCFDRTGLIT